MADRRHVCRRRPIEPRRFRARMGAVRRRVGAGQAAVSRPASDDQCPWQAPVDPSRIVSAARVSIRTSPDPAGAPLFYREVNLPFLEAIKDPAAHIRWRFGDIASPGDASDCVGKTARVRQLPLLLG